jgi:hypothetical protein
MIHNIAPLTFSDLLRLKVLRIDMNPFTCSCDLLLFRGFLAANHRLMVDTYKLKSYNKLVTRLKIDVRMTRLEHSKLKYTCFDRNESVDSFFLPAQACLSSQELSGYIITFCSIYIVILTSALLVYSYRWHFRLLVYEAFRGRDDGARRRRLLQNKFDFDVFVSYDKRDLPWVRRHPMAELEGRMGLRLCVHERDFVIGYDIVDNIAECVEHSKKVMMVFSRHFVRSQWCQFELTYCLRHVMDYDDALIIVCKDYVASGKMTSAMMAVMKTTTYIQ